MFTRFLFVVMVVMLLITNRAANAAPMEFTRTFTGAVNGDTPKSIFLQVGTPGQADRIGVVISNLLPDSRERTLHYTADDGLARSWMITESNAADYGFDWNAFGNQMVTRTANKQTYFNLGTAPTTSGLSILNFPSLRLAEFQLERIEIHLEYWFWHPELAGLRGTRLNAKIIGDGKAVPEPCAGAMIVVGAAAIAWVVRKRPGGMHRGK